MGEFFNLPGTGQAGHGPFARICTRTASMLRAMVVTKQRDACAKRTTIRKPIGESRHKFRRFQGIRYNHSALPSPFVMAVGMLNLRRFRSVTG